MLKRIAVLGGNPGLLKAFSAGVSQRDDVFIESASGTLPPLTDGLITAGDPVKGLGAAEALAERHGALYLLLAEAIDCREALSAGTSKRVMEHAARFGKALGLSAAERIRLERGALLRGIGKLRVPNKVLLKDGLLTYDEWALIQDHPRLGAELVHATPGLEDLEEAVLRYHECYDGTGYPDKLEGETIPLLGRIVRLLDVYCAMTSPRPYRSGTASKADAVAHLESERGKHFDPTLVDAFLQHDIGDEA
jgi:HD-GYP domain-containing protein (c-di-GMP phosphodiesterase class II)